MFQSVIETQGMRHGRFGTGAFISFAVHAGLLAGVLWLTAPRPEVEVQGPKDLVIHLGPKAPMVAKGYRDPAPAATVRPKPRADRIPRHAPTARPPEATPTDTPPSPPAADEVPAREGVLGGDPRGSITSSLTNIPFVPSSEGQPTGEDVLVFGSGMTKPRMVSGPALEYTREALEAHVEGTLIVRCTITREGETEACKVLKGLPHLSEAVRSALEARRYTPVTFQGRPVSVSYVFNVQLKLPQ
ncbi:energy transducer TonB [Aggregicoccus sp. 17bor-14]|uniref:energy transducer TonB n=1 Tax=Myxococcaceae TaxID=31 RepID=UPI00129CD5B3|nr:MULTISPECIES: energy transducer TonB [Myxococcaceae]MBF5043351.1 energy transducer TonB [Simulacricoccus sp. 17bor-14]MRI89110.1 energy transducer TonB [Aggregicoccus sp. 17bor-14]